MPNVSGLTTDARAAIAFKKLLGLANTSTFGKAFYNESIASQISIFTDEIITEEIPEDPSNAPGILEQVECELSSISGTGDHAWNIVFPSGYSGYFNTNDTASGGDPVRNFTQIIPKKFNVDAIDQGGYGYILKDNSGTIIGVTDASRWQVDPVAGIIKTAEVDSQDNELSTLNLGNGGTLTVYLYTGEFLKQTLDDIAANAGNVEVLDDSSSLTTDVDSLDFTTNISATNSGGDVTVSNDIQDTGDLPEGSNEYYTTSKVENDVDSFLTAGNQIGLNNTGSNLEINNLRTDEDVEDIVGNLLVQGTGEISVDYVDSQGTLTIDNTRSDDDIQNLLASTLEPGVNVDFTNDIVANDDFIIAVQDESIEDVVGNLLVEGSNVNLNYVDSQDQLTVTVTDDTIQDTAWVDPVSGSSSTLNDADSSLINVVYDNTSNTASFEIERDLGQYDNNQGWISDLTGQDTEDLNEPSGGYSQSGVPQTYSDNGAHPYFTKERAQDAVSEALTNSTNNLITITYTDSSNEIKLTVENNLSNYTNDENWISDITGENTEDLDEPSNGYGSDPGNLPDTYSDTGKHPYLTLSRVRKALSAPGSNNDLKYDENTGEFEVFNYSTSDFNTDLGKSTTNQLDEPNSVTVPQTYSDSNDHVYFTKERAQDAVNEALTGGSGIDIEYNDSLDEIILRATSSGGTTFTAINSADNSTYQFDTITFGVDLEVFSSGTDEVTVDFVGSGGSGGVGVSDNAGPTSYNGSLLETSDGPSLNGISNIDFNDQLEVIDDGDGTVTINSLVPTENIDTRLNSLENLLPSGFDLRNKVAPSGLNDGDVAFDSSNPIPNRNNANSDPSTIGASLTVGDTFEISGARRGIIDLNYSGSSFGGDLNPGVPGPPDTENHESRTFDNATEGTLELVLNGDANNPVDVVDLSTIGTISNDPTINLNDTDRGSFAGGGGITVSDAKPLTFPDGSAFTDNYQRRGEWRIDTSELVPGYNRIEVRHYYSGGSQTSPFGDYDTTGEIYYVLDDDHEVNNRLMDFTGFSFGTADRFGAGPGDNLSGITYNTKVESDITFNIDNIYYYTYENDNGVVSVDSSNFTVDAGDLNIPDPNSNDMTNSAQFNSKSITSVDFIKGGDFVIQNVTAQDPVEEGSDEQYNPSNDSNLYINAGREFLVNRQINQNSDDLNNDFDQEVRRINGNKNFNSDFNNGGAWTTTETLEDTNTTAGYSNGLQSDIDPTNNRHILSYPSFNYNALSDAPTNPDYSTDTSGIRYYWGWWIDQTAASNFNIKLFGDDNINIVSNDTTLNSGDNNIKVAISLPDHPDEAPTGWLDVTQDFSQGNYGTGQFNQDGSLDGDAASSTVIDGCASEQAGPVGSNDYSLSGGTDIGFTTGNRSAGIEFSNNPGNYRKIYYRIIVPENWPGFLSRASVDWNA